MTDDGDVAAVRAGLLYHPWNDDWQPTMDAFDRIAARLAAAEARNIELGKQVHDLVDALYRATAGDGEVEG